MITDAGVYTMPADEYHAHDALSSSGARRLLPPSCPALFRWHRDNPQAPSRVFDFGHAAHKMVLGAGPEIVVVEANDYRTKAAQEARDEARAGGLVPLLPHEHQTVKAMASELRAHPIAGPALQHPGRPEQSLFSIDKATGVTLRARVDWLPEPVDGRIVIPDYKTAVSAEPAAFARALARYGYAQQDAWYRDMAAALALAEEVEFLFLVQEKDPPYLVQPFTLDPSALRIARRLNREALELFAECSTTHIWPSYSSEVETLSLPAWMDEEEMAL